MSERMTDDDDVDDDDDKGQRLAGAILLGNFRAEPVRSSVGRARG